MFGFLVAASASSHCWEPLAAHTRKASQADPQADLQLDLSCDACGHQWQAPFDIVAFLWTELNAWAQRRLSEIHVLAKAYGWTEPEVLALSPWRRQVYLNMVRQ